MNEFVLITGMALVTFAVRYPLLVLVGKVRLPDRLMIALRYVAPSVLAAIVVPALVLDAQGALHLALDNAALLAGAFTAILMWRTQNLLLTIVAGMAVFLLLKAVA